MSRKIYILIERDLFTQVSLSKKKEKEKCRLHLRNRQAKTGTSIICTQIISICEYDFVFNIYCFVYSKLVSRIFLEPYDYD